MMELVRQWLLGVACTAMVLALADSLAPKGSVKKVCRLAGGMALLLAAAGPLLRLDGGAPALLDGKGIRLAGFTETTDELPCAPASCATTYPQRSANLKFLSVRNTPSDTAGFT